MKELCKELNCRKLVGGFSIIILGLRLFHNEENRLKCVSIILGQLKCSIHSSSSFLALIMIDEIK